MSKLYCSIYNGLGNQLFGYALGVYVSKKYSKTLHIDLTKLTLINTLSRIGIKRDSQRQNELHKLGFKHPVRNIHYLGMLRKLKYFQSKRYVIADFRNTHRELGLISPNQHIYTIGWGDFSKIKDVVTDLRAKFNPNFELTAEILKTKKLILENNAVALHVRRCDYQDVKIGKRFSNICTDAYYQNAIRKVTMQVENPYFIIFSDDIEYVEEKYKFDNYEIVKGNPGYVDLYLMSLCKHFILANSTFSFWAAMLNDHENKLVCIPEYWHNSPREIPAFIPSEWSKIKIN